MKKEHVFSLDFVRALAAVLIVLYHYNVESLLKPEIGKPIILFVEQGNVAMAHMGVSLFFILTGASLAYSCGEQLDIKRYAKRRFLSIYPQYWTTYAVFFAYYYLIRQIRPFHMPLWTLGLSALGMDGYFYYCFPAYYIMGEWFVGCIIFVYLLFPLLHWGVRKRPALTALIVGAIYTALLFYYPFEMEQHYFVFTRLPEVLFGMYFVRYVYGTKEKRERYDWRWGLGALAALILAFVFPVPIPEPLKILWTGIPTFLFLVWVGQMVRSEKVKWFISVYAKYTFSIFLVHHIIVERVARPFIGRTPGRPETYAAFILCLLLSGILGVFFYWLSQWLTQSVRFVISIFQNKTENSV